MLSAADNQNPNEIATRGRERYRLLPTVTSKSFADVREVSADLEATHPARPAACQAAFSRAQASWFLPATLTSIANVCALRSDISGHTAVASST